MHIKSVPYLIALLLLMGLAAYKVTAAPVDDQPDIALRIRSSQKAAFSSQLRIRSKTWQRAIRKALAQPIPQATAHNPYADAELELTLPDPRGGVPTLYLIEEDGTLTHTKSNTAYRLPAKANEQLLALVSQLRKQHYGKLLSWKAANKAIPRMAYMTIVDLETGLTFRGQRRAGSAHADVQPVTASDSAVMKKIYGDQWSWHRRAVIIQTDKGYVAASMHGMPHGGDGIPGNRFNGHFCVHFAGCVTHGSGQVDPAHQVMVHKAAGQLTDYLRGLDSLEIVDLFVAAANQQDPHLLSLVLKQSEPESAMMSTWIHPAITGVRRLSSKEESLASIEPDNLSATVRVQLRVFRTGAKPTLERLLLRLAKPTNLAPWQIVEITPSSTR